MNPELQQRIAAIKAECKEILRLEPAIAGPGKWEAQRDDKGQPCVMCGDFYVAEMTPFAPRNGDDCTMEENASFIAHSRNVSPAMARVVVAWIKDAEADGYAMILEHIANQWEGKL